MVTLIIIAFSAATAALLLGERQHRNLAQTQHHYLKMLLLGDLHSERYIEELSLLAGARTKMVAAQVVAELSPIIYRLDAQYIDGITRELHLSDFLIEKSRHARGAKQIYLLSMLSKIPLEHFDLELLEPYTHSKDRLIRLFALLATINADRKNILRHIASYPFCLNPFELSQLLAMLRQGALTVAYQPMLAFDSVNVKMVGIAVVRHFGIDEAEGELRKIIDLSDHKELRRQALYALASMRLLLCTPTIAQFVKGFSNLEHQRFLRYLACEGYAQGVIDFFAWQSEAQYLQSFINSHKVKIECL
ncbi:MAG: hypothetical protein SNF93_08340 [Rikenellaceae bacterium]